MTWLEREIREQPEVVARALDAQAGALDRLGRTLRERGPGTVMIAARGSSDNAARYAQYLLGERLLRPVALAAPSLHSLHGADAVPRGPGDLVVGISQSGRSPDVVGVVDAARRAGTATVALTNDPGSPLAGAAEHVLDLHAEPERSVAATKTYTTTLALLAALAAAAGDDPPARAAVRELPARIAAAIRLAFGAADTLGDVAAEHVVCVSRGYNYATAMEIALKIRELTATVAEGFSSADLMHGPIAAAGPRTLAVAIATGSPAGASTLAAVEALRARGARSLVIGAPQHADLAIPPVPEWLSPVVAAVPGQVLALRLAERAAVDVDRPAGLLKVTETY